MAVTHWWFKHHRDNLYTNLRQISRHDLERINSHRLRMDPYAQMHMTRPPQKYIYEIFLPFDSQATALGLFTPNNDVLEMNSICDTVRRDLDQGQCYLLLNNSCEAWFDSEFIEQITTYLQSQQIPLSQVIYLSNAANHHKLNSGGMKTAHVPVFMQNHRNFYTVTNQWQQGKLWPTATEILDNPVHRTLNNHSYLCYNYNQHPQRVLLLALLAREGLLNHGLISMPARGYRGTYLEAYEQYRDLVDTVELGLDTHWGQVVSELLPMELVPNFSRSIQDHAFNAIEQYTQTVFSLVTETFFFRDEIHLTEKIYKPLSFKHPFVLVSVPGSLKWLHNQGFKTFGNYWDESYDNERNHAQRLLKIVKVVKEITQWDFAKRQQFLYDVWPILQHNYNLLLELEKDSVYPKIFANTWGV